MQIGRPQAVRAGDGDAGVVESLPQGRDDIGQRQLARLEDDHDGARRAPQGDRDGVPGSERCGRPDELVVGAIDGHPTLGDDHHLRVGGAVVGEGLQGRWHLLRPDPGHHDDGRGAAVRLFLQRGHGVDGPVGRLAVLDDVGQPGRLQLEARTPVDDTPACRLEARLELIGGGPVSLCACSGAGFGQCHDLRRSG